ncbi:hypothetical protein JCM8547_006151 [Rhodosporidiobolus lusitaniae]
MAEQVSQAQWAAKYAEAQANATRATKLELDRQYDAAFTTYLSAAQIYLFLIRHTTDNETKAKLRTVSGKLVERAERIKAARKESVAPAKRERLSLEEQDAVIERGAVVNKLRLPRWRAQDDVEETSPTPRPEQPPLSPPQLEQACTWVSARRAFPSAPVFSKDGRSSDIVQDNVSDCSVVAALIVAAEHHSRFDSKLGLSCLFPHDEHGLLRTGRSGFHTVRLLVNGTWRKITIDDSLPVSPSGQPLGAFSRNHAQLWPSLLEKAYLRLMGGYNFIGSNSANDLYTMSGWLPESIALRTGFRSESTWTRIFGAFRLGKCVLTVGTGKETDEALSSAGLVPSHNYAVVDLRERNGKREIVLVNPWRNATRPTADSWTTGLREALDDEEEDHPGALVADWETLPAHFASIHLNWDPAVFDHSSTVHISASPSSTPSVSSKHRHSTRLRLQLDSQPSFSSEVWLFLARHSSNPLGKDEYIGLTVSSSNGSSAAPMQLKLEDTSSMTDNLFFLYRFLPEPSTFIYDLAISHEGTSASFSFTLQAFSNIKHKLEDGPTPLPYSVSLQGSWSGSTAGGNHTCCTFLNNPQYVVKLSPPPNTSPAAQAAARGELEVVAEMGKDTPVNVKLLYAGGKRVGDFEDRDIVAGASTYSYGLDSLRKTALSPGSYTLILSSFSPLHSAPFSFSVRSSLPVEVTPIPPEGAGMYARTVKGCWEEGCDGGREERGRNPRFRLRVSKRTTVKIRLQLPFEPKPSALFLYTATSSGELGELVASTLPYADPVCGVVLEVVRLEPREEGYLVLPSTYSAGVHARFQILLYADAPVSFS